MIYHLSTLLVCQLAGEFLSQKFNLIIPGPVVGMVILLGLLLIFPKLATAIQPTALGLLAHLSLLFVPAGVGIVSHLDRLGADGVPILFALAISTAIAISVGALAFVGVSRFTEGKK